MEPNCFCQSSQEKLATTRTRETAGANGAIMKLSQRVHVKFSNTRGHTAAAAAAAAYTAAYTAAALIRAVVSAGLARALRLHR